MLDTIKIVIVFVGLLFIVLGIFVYMLGFLFNIGFILIGLWAILTIFTWKSNPLSESIIALLVMAVGGCFAVLNYSETISELL